MLSVEEQAFLDGPVEELCRMIDDWEITHERADLPPEIWDFLKKKKFFGMIIPKEYGGLGFSALAHSAVLQKMAGMSTTLVSTVAVPNSLGPGELLVHYGTKEQKDHYLPRLADGREVPCFALTGPYAGSDATSIPDYGIVCKGEWNGANVVGVRLTFDKRYITLAPVATIVGLAFRMYDPDRILGDVDDLGITLALLPRETKGLEIGRRHFPLNVPFQNGPVRGKDVFVPLSQLIGGPDMAGPGLAHAGRVPLGRPRDLAAVEHGRRHARGARSRPAPMRASASSSACRSDASKASRKRSRGSAATPTPIDRALARDGGRGRSRRKARGAVGDRQIPRDRARARSREGRDGRARRQGRDPRPVELDRPRLAGRADRDHRRRREHHDAQPDDLRPGRDPLPSVCVEGNAGAAHRRLSRAH